jgi:hypothetical protein
MVGILVNFLLSFASTIIPGIILLDTHDQNIDFPFGMYVFPNGVSSSTKEGPIFLRLAVSASVY